MTGARGPITKAVQPFGRMNALLDALAREAKRHGAGVGPDAAWFTAPTNHDLAKAIGYAGSGGCIPPLIEGLATAGRIDLDRPTKNVRRVRVRDVRRLTEAQADKALGRKPDQRGALTAQRVDALLRFLSRSGHGWHRLPTPPEIAAAVGVQCKSVALKVVDHANSYGQIDLRWAVRPEDEEMTAGHRRRVRQFMILDTRYLSDMPETDATPVAKVTRVAVEREPADRGGILPLPQPYCPGCQSRPSPGKVNACGVGGCPRRRQLGLVPEAA